VAAKPAQGPPSDEALTVKRPDPARVTEKIPPAETGDEDPTQPDRPKPAEDGTVPAGKGDKAGKTMLSRAPTEAEEKERPVEVAVKTAKKTVAGDGPPPDRKTAVSAGAVPRASKPARTVVDPPAPAARAPEGKGASGPVVALAVLLGIAVGAGLIWFIQSSSAPAPAPSASAAKPAPTQTAAPSATQEPARPAPEADDPTLKIPTAIPPEIKSALPGPLASAIPTAIPSGWRLPTALPSGIPIQIPTALPTLLPFPPIKTAAPSATPSR
jgi:hypothetical protein